MAFLSGEQFCMIDDFLIDVVVTEEHEFEAEVTEYPVESGANISDNIRSKPVRVSMEGVVTASPLTEMVKARPGRERQNADGTTTVIEPPADAYGILLAIRDAREPVTIRTSLATFTNMAMESFTVPRDASTGDALRFTAKFRQIRSVTNNRSLKRIKRVAVPNGSNKNNKGTLLSWVQATFLGTPVISYPVAERAARAKEFGKPILTTIEGVAKNEAGVRSSANGIRIKDGLGTLDHYKLTNELQKRHHLDGYVTRNEYHNMSDVEWDSAARAWQRANDAAHPNGFPPRKHPPGYDAWKVAEKDSGSTSGDQATKPPAHAPNERGRFI